MIYEAYELVDNAKSLRDFFLIGLTSTIAAHGGKVEDFWDNNGPLDVRLTVNGIEIDLEETIASFDKQMENLIGQEARNQLDALNFYKLTNFMDAATEDFIRSMRRKARELGFDINTEEDYR